MVPAIPLNAQAVRKALQARRTLTPQETAFFTDPGLASFWRHIEQAMSGCRHEAYEYLAGAFFGPLASYGAGGTADRPSPKVRRRKRQQIADQHMDTAARLSRELLQVLRDMEQTTMFLPDEIHLDALLVKAGAFIENDGPDDATRSYIARSHTRVWQLLEKLAEAFEQYPRTPEQFADVPGMRSQKATWRDWLYEAEANLRDLNRMYGARLELTEAHWVSLVHAMIGEAISRSSVNDALRSARDFSRLEGE
jgi:hypothetical protein